MVEAEVKLGPKIWGQRFLFCPESQCAFKWNAPLWHQASSFLMWSGTEKIIVLYVLLSLQRVNSASQLTSPSSCPTQCWASDAAPTSLTTFSLVSPGNLERWWENTRGLCHLVAAQSHRLSLFLRLFKGLHNYRGVSQSLSRYRKGGRCAGRKKIKTLKPCGGKVAPMYLSHGNCLNTYIILLTCLIK